MFLLSILKNFVWRAAWKRSCLPFTLQRTIFKRKTGVERKIVFPFYITNGQNESKCHDFVSRMFSSLPFNGHFSLKTWHPFSKNFSCPWSPLYLAKWIRGRFCPRFLEKVSETAKQSLCAAPNCPFYFPTDKMMRSVTVSSHGRFPLTLQRTKYLQIRG